MANAFYMAYDSVAVVLLMANDFVINGSLLMLFVVSLRRSLTDTLVCNLIVLIVSEQYLTQKLMEGGTIAKDGGEPQVSDRGAAGGGRAAS